MKKTWVLVLWAFLQAVPAAAAELRLTCPNGGETVCLGRPLRITWLATAVSQKVRLVLRRSGSGVVGEIAANLNASDLSYNWPSAGRLSTGEAPEGTRYLIRLSTMDGTLGDTCDAPFALKKCAAGVHPLDDLKVIQTKPKLARPSLPPREMQRQPKLIILGMAYNYSGNLVEARIRNIGNAPLIGHVLWQFVTECGVFQGSKDFTPGQASCLEDPAGYLMTAPCPPIFGACTMPTSFSIEPVAVDGTSYGRASIERNLPCYEQGKLLLESRRLKFIFLHGSRWVNCGSQCVITAADAYDYDPETGKATFTLGFPLKNCGAEAARNEGLYTTGLNWYVFHTPSNMITDNDSVPWPPAPVESGQGAFVENSISLKVRDGIYMLTVYVGSGEGQVTLCSIPIRFAEDLLR